MSFYTFKQSGAFKEFVQKVEGQKDPMSGRVLKPASSVAFWPTVKAGDNQAVVMNSAATGWVLVDDYRNTQFWDANGDPQTIKELGVTVPAGASLTPPSETV